MGTEVTSCNPFHSGGGLSPEFVFDYDEIIVPCRWAAPR